MNDHELHRVVQYVTASTSYARDTVSDILHTGLGELSALAAHSTRPFEREALLEYVSQWTIKRTGQPEPLVREVLGSARIDRKSELAIVAWSRGRADSTCATCASSAFKHRSKSSKGFLTRWVRSHRSDTTRDEVLCRTGRFAIMPNLLLRSCQAASNCILSSDCAVIGENHQNQREMQPR